MSSETFDAAFRHLFEERSVPLLRYLGGLTDDPVLAEDIAQECFLKLYRRGSMPDTPAAWLVAVAHNLVRDEYRRRRRRRRLLWRRAGEAPVADPPPETDAAALAADRRACARLALARLPERDQRLLLLRHEGYAYREIGAILNLAPGGIGTLLARATEAFRRSYDALHHARD